EFLQSGRLPPLLPSLEQPQSPQGLLGGDRVLTLPLINRACHRYLLGSLLFVLRGADLLKLLRQLPRIVGQYDSAHASANHFRHHGALAISPRLNGRVCRALVH
ncbi:MAG: hypothetical protein ABWU16_08765, partial [Halothiobacillaceae bacterium]